MQLRNVSISQGKRRAIGEHVVCIMQKCVVRHTRHVDTYEQSAVALCTLPGVTMDLALSIVTWVNQRFRGDSVDDVWHRPARRQPPSFIQSEYALRIAAGTVIAAY